MSPQNIACVVVFFNPEAVALKTVNRLAFYGYLVVVVVNQATPHTIQRLQQVQGVHPIINLSNLGLATALNQGIRLSFDQLNVDYVTLFDQDSLPESDLPLALALEFEAFPRNTVACIGPMLRDRKDPTASYAQNDLEFFGRMPATIPTSGTLISLEAWRAVGPMLDCLFIDCIDHEWCLRAQCKGYQIRLSRTVTMVHDMGDMSVKILGRYKPIHKSPTRHYFIVRNALFLASLDYLPRKWRLIQLAKTVRRIAVYLCVSSDRPKSFKLIYRAMADGLHGRLGPCPVV